MLKKTVLEFGGSDPYLILEAADLELAAISTKGRLVNSGQSCIAAKRFIVVDKVRRAFEELFVKQMSAARIGELLTTRVNPLSTTRRLLIRHGPSRPRHGAARSTVRRVPGSAQRPACKRRPPCCQASAWSQP